MYLPDVYKIENDKKIQAFIEANSFADLVTFHNGELLSNKVPLLFDKPNNCLYGHFGKSNPQLKHLLSSNEVLVIFSGPHAYISPQWYKSQNMVPTWNFQTLQLRGKPRLVNEEKLLTILEKLTAFHESGLDNPWTMKQLAEKPQSVMLQMIVGFEIDINTIQFKEKMSQNRSEQDQASVIEALKEQGGYEKDRVAQIMNDNLKSTKN